MSLQENHMALELTVVDVTIMLQVHDQCYATVLLTYLCQSHFIYSWQLSSVLHT